MTSLFHRLAGRGEERSAGSLSFDDWLSYFTFNGVGYQLGGQPSQTIGGRIEEIGSDFQGVVQGAYKANGVVFACVTARQLVFSEARFQFQRYVKGRPGDLFSTPDLQILETPSPGQFTSDLLARALVDADLAGNWFGARRGGEIVRMRPDWVTIVAGSNHPPGSAAAVLDARVIGYLFQPNGPSSDDVVALLPEEVAHFAPLPDPAARWRGMSWLTPVIREVMGDQAATSHKLKFFEQGATPNMVVSLDKEVKQEAFGRWVKLMEGKTAGHVNAYRTLFLGAGAKAEVVGSDLRSIDFRAVQGAGETRITAAARVPAIIVGLSEGLASATYSNFGQARRAFADLTMRPLWKKMAEALSTIVPPPSGTRLFYDDRYIPFLQEDVKDAADIAFVDAQAIKALTDAGFDAESVVTAVVERDYRMLRHTGLFSVQLQPPGTQLPGGADPGPDPARMVATVRGLLSAPQDDGERSRVLAGLIEARSTC